MYQTHPLFLTVFRVYPLSRSPFSSTPLWMSTNRFLLLSLYGRRRLRKYLWTCKPWNSSRVSSFSAPGHHPHLHWPKLPCVPLTEPHHGNAKTLFTLRPLLFLLSASISFSLSSSNPIPISSFTIWTLFSYASSLSPVLFLAFFQIVAEGPFVFSFFFVCYIKRSIFLLCFNHVFPLSCPTHLPLVLFFFLFR